MQLRPLGRSGLSGSPLCLGGNVFGWTADEATSHALLDRYAEAGGNFIDTANVYSSWVPGHVGGESESVIGRWLRASGQRDRMIVATKVGMDMPGLGKGLTRAQIERGAEDSLRRLHVERIDLYYAHEDDPKRPLDETLAAFDGLVRDGKVRAIGASNYSAERLDAAVAASAAAGSARYECLQPLYNLMDRTGFENQLAATCARHEIGVATYFSLASGFLSGKYRSAADLERSPRGSGVAKYLAPRGLRILDALDEVGRRHDAKPAEVALAWLMARDGVTAPIASATTVAQLASFSKAAEMQLGAEDQRTLEAASAA